MAEPALIEPTGAAEGDTIAQAEGLQEPGRLRKLGVALIDRFGASPGVAPDAGVIKPGESYEAARLAQGGPTHMGESDMSPQATERAEKLSDELDRLDTGAAPGYSSRPEGSIRISKGNEAPTPIGASPIDAGHLQRNSPSSDGISGPQVKDVNPAPAVNPPLQMRPRNF